MAKQSVCAQCVEAHVTHELLPAEGNFMEKLSDLIGSVRGIWALAAVEAAYMVVATTLGFDRYPFNFLTLVLSLIALQFSQIIIVVQNRQGAIQERKAIKERTEVAEDLELDKKAYDLLAELHGHLMSPAAESGTRPVTAADQHGRTGTQVAHR